MVLNSQFFEQRGKQRGLQIVNNGKNHIDRLSEILLISNYKMHA